MSPDMMHYKEHNFTSVVFWFPQNAWSEFNIKENLKEIQIERHFTNNWKLVFKSIRMLKAKIKSKIVPDKVDQGHLHTMWDPRFDSGLDKKEY